MSERKQILVCGTVNGAFEDLFKRIKKINKKSGPYTAVYCVGNFFVEGCESPWNKVKSEGCVIPLYIFGPHCSSASFSQFVNGCEGELARNVIYLGKRGILKSNGLKIAYLGGTDSEQQQHESGVYYSKEDVQFIRDSCIKADDFKGVDLLLTYEWPGDVVNHETRENIPKGNLPNGSDKISWLALHIRPQYIFCGKENIYYARRPYRNYFGGSKENVTRFVALSHINGPKFISAYFITPVDHIDASQIIPNIFDSPFNRHLLELDSPPSNECILKSGESQQFFYDTKSRDNSSKRKQNAKDRGGAKKAAFDVDNCWFCLSSKNVEKHLVVTVGEEMYITLAKGCLTPEHLIIIPIGHHYSALELPSSAESELEKLKDSLRAFFKSTNQVPIFFERSYKCFHCQIHVIPIPDDIQGIKPIFQEAAEREDFTFHDLPPNVPLKEIVEKKSIETSSGNKLVNPPYFYLEISPDTRMVVIIQKNFPLEFGREVIASKDILNLPDRDSWKSCVMSKEEESKMTLKFRQDFKKFNGDQSDDSDG